jgi:hypothetical protein
MCRNCDAIIEELWQSLSEGQTYKTPDIYKGKIFTINFIEYNKIQISPQNISIYKKAFSVTLHYLIENDRNGNNPIEIRSNDDPEKSGPLCFEARRHNKDIRCINYILPMLCKNDIVGINGNRPNKTWILG